MRRPGPRDFLPPHLQKVVVSASCAKTRARVFSLEARSGRHPAFLRGIDKFVPQLVRGRKRVDCRS